MIDNACEWGASTFLIISENVGALVYYTHIFPLLISLFLGIQILINNPKALVNRVLFFVTAMFGLWVYFDLILWASPTPEFVMFFWSAIVPIEMLIYLGSVYLVYLFSHDQKDAPVWLKSVFALTMLPMFLFTHTDLNVVGILPDCDEGALEGPLIQYMYFVEILFIFVAIWFVIKGRSLQNALSRKKALYIGIATVLFLAFFSAGNMTLLFSLSPLYEQYKLFGMPVFAAIVTYTILRFGAFKTKTLLTDILITTLWILLFSTLLFEEIGYARIVIAITLIPFTFLGLMLAQNVRREVEQRREIEQLAEKLQKANVRLKSLDKMKSEFVSIASHQLRSPLTAIRGHASMLLEGSYGQLSQKVRDAIERIGESSRFMALSIEDYLNVSRIEAGNMKYEMVDFDLATMTRRLTDDLRPAATKRGLVLMYRSDCEGSCIVHADEGKMRQVIQNLIDNAMKYTPKGSIDVVAHSDEQKMMHISIKDTGVGMSPETIEDAFDKFVRAKNAASVNSAGTGLGLFVAKKMLEEMGGHVWAESEGEGKGSTFHVSIPTI